MGARGSAPPPHVGVHPPCIWECRGYVSRGFFTVANFATIATPKNVPVWNVFFSLVLDADFLDLCRGFTVHDDLIEAGNLCATIGVPCAASDIAKIDQLANCVVHALRR